MKSYRTAIFDNGRWQGFESRPGDIFVCTPPKCGTTWTQTIVVNLLFPDGNLPGSVMELSPWVEANFMMPAEAMHAMLAAQKHRRVMKSHTPADGIPWFDHARYLFVCRDGRDAFMSMVNHMDRLKIVEAMNEKAAKDGVAPVRNFNGDVHDFFDEWLSAGVEFFDMVNSYWRMRDRPNLMLVHFNDLKQDLGAEVRRIADFLGITVPESDWPDVVKRCTFDYMRENDGMVGDMSLAFEGGTKGFLFKGTNGRWQNVLTDEELARYERRLHDTLPAEAVDWVTNGRHGQPG